ncbi:Dimer_Tnp_hAT domain-containing protein [Cephalotus follicularis]|uniref:Dimer_Tnp_hAT domain-containing protein n=1 Tax=Cephalotus follicularis TaxID=3775 RepID=A0A1Q3CV17_CEPFO|nr:Dimer_Tnp_hAT domain-containing protein [Cephalotus follicularis]
MIEKVKKAIYRHEGKRDDEFSSFYFVVHEILVDRWNKSNTPLHCLAHSLNPSLSWLNETSNRQPPHQDNEITKERKIYLKRIFPNNEEFRAVQVEYGKFSGCLKSFSDSDSMSDRGKIDPKHWWLLYGSSTPLLQKLALKLLGQPSSSSCAERNWSTYSFVHSIKRNKMTPQRAEDLVFVHTNLRLLSSSPTYKEGGSKMWDVGGDHHDSFEDVGVLEVANLSLDETDMEAVIFTDDGLENEGNENIEVESIKKRVALIYFPF